MMSFGLPGWPATSPSKTLEVDLYCRAGERAAGQQRRRMTPGGAHASGRAVEWARVRVQ